MHQDHLMQFNCLNILKKLSIQEKSIPYVLVKPFKDFISLKDKFDNEPSEVTYWNTDTN